MPEETVASLLKQAAAKLEKSPGGVARLEAEILLSHLLQTPRSHLFAWPEMPVPKAIRRRFEVLLAERIGGEPIAYLTGNREFWSLELRVNRDTLIPRPETELLVEQTLEILRQRRGALVADLGTGSGAISAALASERPDWRIIATDRSFAALAIARENFRRLGLGNVHCAGGAWCDALAPDGEFDAIVSNPPYIADGDPHLQQHGLDREPAAALVSGSDGLDDIRCIVEASLTRLKADGWLLLEHGYCQGGAVRRLLRAGGYRDCASRRDLAGQERISWGRRAAG
ncbi:MAG: peptide chain release factor N(5)-glutamine methyltransferase [Gammaproteobacteria bacterium]|nr:peptide chain release factor N(5)-glutamine methyltransferase [Gammaproteobacteria bacterium]